MAGTAAGAAKATAARQAQAERRRKLSEQSTNHLETVSRSLAVVDDVAGGPSAVVLHGQTVAPLVPLAGQVVADVLTGKLKASPAVRSNTALEVLRQAQKPATAPGGVSAEATAALVALGRALAAQSKPAERVVGGEVVAEQ